MSANDVENVNCDNMKIGVDILEYKRLSGYGFFSLFFDGTMIEILVSNTNFYAEFHSSRPLSLHDGRH